jgi:hypothetical protein
MHHTDEDERALGHLRILHGGDCIRHTGSSRDSGNTGHTSQARNLKTNFRHQDI